jgi:iron complex outermembrane recepter protein
MLQPHSRNLAHVISTVLALSSFCVRYAHAQAQPQQSGEEGDLFDTAIVTGARREDRTIADSPVPIDVLSEPVLENQGFTETNRVLNTLVPSFNFPQPSITDGTDVIRPAHYAG